MREDNVLAYATIDAGPHVKVLVQTRDAEIVTQRLAKVPGVLRVLTTKPGRGAHVEGKDV
jgi:diphosphomevalonate decarboxylase